MDFCINHSTERAVGLCGTCRRPACYRCSLTIDQVIYCSTACFNERPAKGRPAPSPSPSPVALADEYSDVVAAIDSRTSRTDLAEPSVVLGAHMADDHSQTTMLGMNAVAGHKSDGSLGDGSTLLAGNRRALLSSSCFFHPDTSAIVLCVKCRNPICTLCAKETPEGLTCSPACGPPDLVGVRERRKVTLVNLAIVGAILLVMAESGVLLWASRNSDDTLASIKAETAPRPETLPPVTDPDLRRADSLYKEATTLLRDAADGAELGRKPGNDPAALTSWLGRAVTKLKLARELYASRAGEWTDPEVKRRLETVSTLLDGLKVGNDPASDPGRSPNAVPR